MYSKKLSGFMISDAGQKVWYLAAGALSVGTMCSYFLPHTLFLSEYQKLVQLYRNGFAVPLPKELHDRFEKALELLETDSIDKHLFKPFYAYGFDVMSAGSSLSKYGAIIGLPINFSYDSIETIDKSKMKINHESIIWDSEPALNLLKSLVLSENAQLYAMSREVIYRHTPKPVIDTFLGVNLVLSTYALSRYLNQKFNFYAKPLPLRIIMYSLVGLFNVGFYIMVKDASQIYYEERIDKELREKNRIFVEGGKEFYTKLLERNKALRQLLGKEGERLYSVLGNENYLFRSKHLPIVQRLSAFESQISS